ncbi:hypothetical protein [Solidesulfovibrio sp.]
MADAAKKTAAFNAAGASEWSANEALKEADATASGYQQSQERSSGSSSEATYIEEDEDEQSTGYDTDSSESGGEPRATGGPVRAGGLYHVAEGNRPEVYVQNDGDVFPLTKETRIRPREDGVIVPNPEVAKVARARLGGLDSASSGPGTPQRVAGPGKFTTADDAVSAGRQEAGVVVVRPQGALEREYRRDGVNNLGGVDPSTGKRSDGMQSYDIAAMRRLDPDPNKPLYVDQPNGWGGRHRGSLTGDEKYMYMRDTARKNMEAAAGFYGVAPPRDDPNYAAIYRKNYINNGPESVAGWEKPGGIHLGGVMTNRPNGDQAPSGNEPLTSTMERSLGGRLATNKDGTMTLTKPGTDDITMDGRVMDAGRKPQDLAKFRPMGKGGEDDLATYMTQNLSPEDLKKSAGAIKALQARGKEARDANADRDKILGQIAGGTGLYAPKAEEALAKKYGLVGGEDGGKPEWSPDVFDKHAATLKTKEEQKAAFQALTPEQRAAWISQKSQGKQGEVQPRRAQTSPAHPASRPAQAPRAPASRPAPVNRYDFDYAAGVGGPVSQQGSPVNIESPASAVRRMVGNRPGATVPVPGAAPSLRSGGVLPSPEFMTPESRSSRWSAADEEDAAMKARLRAQAVRAIGLGSYAVTTPDTAAFR